MADYTLSAKITGDASSFNNAMSSAEAKLGAVSKNFQNVGTKISNVGSAISSVGKTFTPVSVAIGGVTAAAGKTSVEFIKLYESSMVVFEKMLGGKDAADKLYGSLLDVAKGSTFSQETFLASGKALVGVGVSAKDTTGYLQAIADAVTAFGGTSENISRVTDAFKKMHTNGRVSMEDINTLSDNGINALKILANQYGVSTDKMREMISDGAVPAKEALAKLTDGIENGTEGANGYTAAMKGMAAAMKGKTLTGALDSMKTSIRTFSLSLLGMNPTLKKTDEGFAENQQRIRQLTAALSTINQIIPMCQKVFQSLTDAIGALLDKLVGSNVVFNESKGEWENVGGALGRLKEKMESMDPESLKRIGDVILAMGAAGVVLPVLGGALSKAGLGISALGTAASALMTPFGLVTLALGGLAAAFIHCYTTNDAFREKVSVAWDAIGEKVTGVTSAVKETLTGLFDGVSSGGALEGISAKFESLKTIASSAMDAIKGKFPELNLSALAFGAAFTGVVVALTGPLSRVPLMFANMAAGIMQHSGVIGKTIQTLGINIAAAFMNPTAAISAIPGVLSKLGTAFMGLFSPVGLITAAITALVAGFVTMFATNEQFRNSVIQLAASIGTSLAPILGILATNLSQMIQTIFPVILDVIQQLMPILGQIVMVILQIVAAIAPLITQLISSLLPVITQIVTVIANVITAIMPALVAILNVIMSVIEAIAPVVTTILTVVINVISNIISALGPIVSVVGAVITGVISVVSPIVTFIANIIASIIQVIGTVVGAVSKVFTTVSTIITEIWNGICKFIGEIVSSISNVIATISKTVSSVFNTIYNIVSSIMGKVKSFITNVFSKIKSAWEGLKGFVGGVFDGIASAVKTLVNKVKGFVNGVIGGINAAIGLINLIPGVEISPIPQLLHGTDNWQGGFAAMNEGGRGELTYLPNGTQVIPHDLSVQYAKEAARANAGAAGGAPIDYDLLAAKIAAAAGGDIVLQNYQDGQLTGERIYTAETIRALRSGGW